MEQQLFIMSRLLAVECLHRKPLNNQRITSENLPREWLPLERSSKAIGLEPSISVALGPAWLSLLRWLRSTEGFRTKTLVLSRNRRFFLQSGNIPSPGRPRVCSLSSAQQTEGHGQCCTNGSSDQWVGKEGIEPVLCFLPLFLGCVRVVN